ncbi:MAG TPA: carbamoyltransferase HypF [Bryobacteraceae bacterium]|nr:carbamoyltransferase HypF [Bryobacteraceae bacterium]
MLTARTIRVRGIVQGVGFRPFVFRLAQANTLTGWVFNDEDGVEIHLEGPNQSLDAFVHSLKTEAPQAAQITAIQIKAADPSGLQDFKIRDSGNAASPTTRISPDLPVCPDCLAELFNPAERRHDYPYINCTNCGPRYSVILKLPYDRVNTTMKSWPLDNYCAHQYRDPLDRRFHAQPVACPECGPNYYLQTNERITENAIAKAADLLNQGAILAIKGLGGYHLACDARNDAAVRSLRERKFRKETPFALMAKNIEVARTLVNLDPESESLLTCQPYPIVLVGQVPDLSSSESGAGSRPAHPDLSPSISPNNSNDLARTLVNLDPESEFLLTFPPHDLSSSESGAGSRPAHPDLSPSISPNNNDLGIMLPYAPLHHLLFAANAPEVLVMTSANRSSEPIAYQDEEALNRLKGIADAFLIGERPIARRVDDSIARVGVFGPVILRRSRGYAPSAVANIPSTQPILAVGADLKNSITLVVNGQAFVSQHIGDLAQYQSCQSFRQTIQDLTAMYEVDWDGLIIAHDTHPQYLSTVHALELPAVQRIGIQHHRAHIASVLAERGEWDKRVLGVCFDGTGYGDDGTIWGGELFEGSIAEGFTRVAHLRPAALPGGDAAARYPVQASAGFLSQIDDLPDLNAAPFLFPLRYHQSLELVRKNTRTFETTSVGRLFDTAAALLGFTREATFEGQAAVWLEHISRTAEAEPYPFPDLDFRPLLSALAADRLKGREVAQCARAFHRGVATGLCDKIETFNTDTVVLSGGVFQNQLLLAEIKSILPSNLTIWTNRQVPPNDGGISLGQAALVAHTLVSPPGTVGDK